MAALIKPAEVINGGIFKAAPLNNRFDQTLISPHILPAELRYLPKLLGQDLYDDMISKQNASVSNYNINVGAIVQKFPTEAAYETLWTKYLLLFVGSIVFNQSLPYINTQVGSQGVFFNDSEFAANAGIQGVKYLQTENQKTIDDLEGIIKDYLCDNKADFTLFDDKDCPCCDDCNDGCGDNCHCGYWNKYFKACPTCKRGKNSSSKIIFY